MSQPSQDGVRPHVPAFTRWGKTTCPGTEGTELIYEGVVVGSPYNEAGTAEYLCLYRQPQFLRTTAGLQLGRGRLYEHRTKQEKTLLLSAVSSIMKLLVLYATLQDETPRSPYLQGHPALLRGQESTMAT